MKSLLLALGLALCCFVQAEWKEVTTTSIEDKGRWMTFAVATNSTDALEHLKYLPAFAADISTPEENVISISALIHMPDGCKNVTYQFKRGEDGKYRGVLDDTTVTVESMKSQGEFVMSTISVGNEFRSSALHSRTVNQNPEIIQKFKEECKRLGFTEQQIVVLDPTGNAIQS
ncbi:extracellular fatty acid-binding protein-like [Erythrolamprus reginae]|uniref:extracellular fatty acid-binding protein-like n=1 Tax=Erythrolamprus reginae TaxID=121349 RepID=UPI00396CC6B9